jgi:hypothetical protein
MLIKLSASPGLNVHLHALDQSSGGWDLPIKVLLSLFLLDLQRKSASKYTLNKIIICHNVFKIYRRQCKE